MTVQQLAGQLWWIALIIAALIVIASLILIGIAAAIGIKNAIANGFTDHDNTDQ